jgi:hypothetical protein
MPMRRRGVAFAFANAGLVLICRVGDRRRVLGLLRAHRPAATIPSIGDYTYLLLPCPSAWQPYSHRVAPVPGSVWCWKA